MTTQISDLTSATALAAADQVPFSPAADRTTKKFSLSLLLSWIQSSLVLPYDLVQQYAAPNATAFSIPVVAGDTWLLLTPTAAFAAGTVVLPLTVVNRNRVRVTTTQAITALTVLGNGRSINGAPTTLAANGFFTLGYDATFNAWYRTT